MNEYAVRALSQNEKRIKVLCNKKTRGVCSSRSVLPLPLGEGGVRVKFPSSETLVSVVALPALDHNECPNKLCCYSAAMRPASPRSSSPARRA